jgi:hypothetical protein
VRSLHKEGRETYGQPGQVLDGDRYHMGLAAAEPGTEL